MNRDTLLSGALIVALIALGSGSISISSTSPKANWSATRGGTAQPFARGATAAGAHGGAEPRVAAIPQSLKPAAGRDAYARRAAGAA